MAERIIPEWQRNIPFVEVVLQTTLDQIPQGPPCVSCGEVMKKSYVPHQVGIKFLLRTDNLPGYECEECELVSLSPEGMLELLTEYREILIERGDYESAKEINASIAIKQEIVNSRHA